MDQILESASIEYHRRHSCFSSAELVANQGICHYDGDFLVYGWEISLGPGKRLDPETRLLSDKHKYLWSSSDLQDDCRISRDTSPGHGGEILSTLQQTRKRRAAFLFNRWMPSRRVFESHTFWPDGLEAFMTNPNDHFVSH
jgi:hypothetical protein